MTDTLLETAVANWGPRFTANGVDASDYQAITSSISHWDEWCARWSAAASTYEDLATKALLNGFTQSAGEHYARAATYYHFAKFLFVHDLAQARVANDHAARTLNAALPFLDPPGKTIAVPFRSTQLAGILRCPKDSTAAAPVVWLIAGLDSAKEEFREVERAFLDRGLATFSIDGPGQGEAEWDLPIEADWREVGEAVLRALALESGVDSNRCGIWGVSLGGYYAANVASSDLPFRATVTLSGPFDFGAHFEKLNELTRRAFVVRSGATSLNDAQQRANQMTLSGVANTIHRPLLVIMGGKDRLFPTSDATELASRATEATLLVLPNGNHGCANVINHHRPYAADWLAHHLQ